NPELTIEALRQLFDEMKLHFQDPLTDIVFETAGRSSTILALIHEMVESEGQLVQLRVRALEALFTRLALGRRAIDPAAAVDETLRSLNDILAEVKRASPNAVSKSQERAAKDLQTVARLLPALTRAQTTETS